MGVTNQLNEIAPPHRHLPTTLPTVDCNGVDQVARRVFENNSAQPVDIEGQARVALLALQMAGYFSSEEEIDWHLLPLSDTDESPFWLGPPASPPTIWVWEQPQSEAPDEN